MHIDGRHGRTIRYFEFDLILTNICLWCGKLALAKISVDMLGLRIIFMLVKRFKGRQPFLLKLSVNMVFRPNRHSKKGIDTVQGDRYKICDK